MCIVLISKLGLSDCKNVLDSNFKKSIFENILMNNNFRGHINENILYITYLRTGGVRYNPPKFKAKLTQYGEDTKIVGDFSKNFLSRSFTILVGVIVFIAGTCFLVNDLINITLNDISENVISWIFPILLIFTSIYFTIKVEKYRIKDKEEIIQYLEDNLHSKVLNKI